MAIRSKPKNRCPRCMMREVLCLCAEAPRLSLQTRVTIVMHWREQAKTSNTGRLALLALPGSELRVRGDRSRPFTSKGLVTSSTLLLFPTEDASELTPSLVRSFSKPVHLVVPDGNWSQARKVATREPSLRSIPRVKLPETSPSRYRLRLSPHPGNLCTFEAIVRALSLIEGSQVEAALNDLFEKMVERVLWSRGKLLLSHCRHPIPEAALRQFFLDGCAGSSREGTAFAPTNQK